tara:strand:- start:222 stop:545 length:324 start_codon:yes stop_codon:yes gene_type:complete
MNKYNNNYQNNKWNYKTKHLNYYIVTNLLKTVIFDYFNFQVRIGTKVAKINEKNNNDCEIIDGKKSVGNIMPTNTDLEKSALGKNNMPAINPIIIEIYEFFSFKDFE